MGWLASDDEELREVARVEGVRLLRLVDLLVLGWRAGPIPSRQDILDSMRRNGFGIAGALYQETLERCR